MREVKIDDLLPKITCEEDWDDLEWESIVLLRRKWSEVFEPVQYYGLGSFRTWDRLHLNLEDFDVEYPVLVLWDADEEKYERRWPDEGEEEE